MNRKGEAWPRPRPCLACLALMLAGVVALLYIVTTLARAQELHPPSGHLAQSYIDKHTAGKPDPYTGIFNFAGINCCTGHDCLQAVDPKDFEPISEGYRLRSTGEIVKMPTTGFSPDNNWHVCRKSNKEKTIRCLLVPAGGA